MTGTTVLITVEGEDDALGLLDWLEQDFPGNARLDNQSAGKGTMGPALDTVSLVITSGFTAMTTALVAYLRTRGMKVDITVKAGDKTVSLKGERIHRTAVKDLNDTAIALAKQLGEE
ncbi:effector-associated constant component EACC1 [Amycolatopsis sp. lyj-23]|uniref:effector-associated constant component EACC1 n=1 Tax=Amycolatopsis sp. lyj-23 TaxID=2789283 RepID=UPI00397E2D1C